MYEESSLIAGWKQGLGGDGIERLKTSALIAGTHDFLSRSFAPWGGIDEVSLPLAVKASLALPDKRGSAPCV